VDNRVVGKWEILAALIFVVFMIYRSANDYTAQPKSSNDWNYALLLCQQVLANASRDPGSASIPYVPNAGSGNQYYFAWGNSTTHAHMKNGLGIDVPVSASCFVDGNTNRITGLTLNGETLI